MDRVLPWSNKCFRRTYAWHSLSARNKFFAYKIWHSSRNLESSESQGGGTWFNLYGSSTWSCNIRKSFRSFTKNPNNADLKEFINLRMSGFHGCWIFLAVIGKRSGSAGLHNLIVEARLLGPESVNQILNGKEYNYGIRICKVIFKAL